MRDIQHHINLTPGSILLNKAIYRISPKKHEEIQGQVDELIAKGLIRENKIPYVVPTFLIPKKEGSPRMCVDGRVVNKITFDYRLLISCLDDLLDQLHGALVFSKIDLWRGYH